MDFADDQRTFACHVAQAALSSDPILFAICAMVLFRRTRIELKLEPSEDAHELYMAAIKGLAPILAQDIATALFCTTILRVYQEYQGRSELEKPLHLAGAVALLQKDRTQLGATDAAVFAILRQDLCSALAHGKALSFPWQNHSFMRSSRQSDSSLANQMSLLLAHRIAAQSESAAASVDAQILTWRRHLPISFKPIECWKSDYGMIIYLQPWHAAAMATFHCALLLSKPDEAHALHILRTALYSNDLGVQVHLCGMISLCKTHLTSQHHPFVDQVVTVLEHATGFSVQMAQVGSESRTLRN
jgi:hypothetical protein